MFLIQFLLSSRLSSRHRGPSQAYPNSRVNSRNRSTKPQSVYVTGSPFQTLPILEWLHWHHRLCVERTHFRPEPRPDWDDVKGSAECCLWSDNSNKLFDSQLYNPLRRAWNETKWFPRFLSSMSSAEYKSLEECTRKLFNSRSLISTSITPSRRQTTSCLSIEEPITNHEVLGFVFHPG